MEGGIALDEVFLLAIAQAGQGKSMTAVIDKVE